MKFITDLEVPPTLLILQSTAVGVWRIMQDKAQLLAAVLPVLVDDVCEDVDQIRPEVSIS